MTQSAAPRTPDSFGPQAAPPPSAGEFPTLPLLHFVAVLNGLGTMLLGPILPLVASRWHLTDAQTGLLLTSQFCGAFLGGVTTSRHLRRGLLEGLAAAALGLALFAVTHGLPGACVGLVLAGFGIGRAITTVNLLAGNRAPTHRGSALSRINLSWGLGALLSPLLAAWLTPRFSLPSLLTGFACCFGLATLWLTGQLQWKSSPERTAATIPVPSRESPKPLAHSIFVYFFLLLFLYGGLETCLSAWLTTFALRYGRDSLVLSEYTMVLLLSGLTAGRAVSAWLLLHMRDRALVRIALALSAVLAAALATGRQTSVIATFAVLLGIALAPIFPGTFAMLLAHHPPARKAGIVLAASGLGAAAFPALMGLLSTQAGSLQRALMIPVALALLLLALSFLPASADAPRPGFPPAPSV
jgi:FHS family glucose/mannose:H+ symporter-like MFS transporter